MDFQCCFGRKLFSLSTCTVIWVTDKREKMFTVQEKIKKIELSLISKKRQKNVNKGLFLISGKNFLSRESINKRYFQNGRENFVSKVAIQIC